MAPARAVSIREIVRRTGRSRNTVKKYLASGVVQPRYPKRKGRSNLAEFAEKLRGWLQAESARGASSAWAWRNSMSASGNLAGKGIPRQWREQRHKWLYCCAWFRVHAHAPTIIASVAAAASSCDSARSDRGTEKLPYTAPSIVPAKNPMTCASTSVCSPPTPMSVSRASRAMRTGRVIYESTSNFREGLETAAWRASPVQSSIRRARFREKLVCRSGAGLEGVLWTAAHLGAREIQASIADAVHRLLSDHIVAMGLESECEVQKTAI